MGDINDNDGNDNRFIAEADKLIKQFASVIVSPLDKFDTSSRHDSPPTLPCQPGYRDRTNRFPNCYYLADPVCLPIVLVTPDHHHHPSTKGNRKSSQLNNRFLPVFLKQVTIQLSVSKWILMGFLSQLFIWKIFGSTSHYKEGSTCRQERISYKDQIRSHNPKLDNNRKSNLEVVISCNLLLSI